MSRKPNLEPKKPKRKPAVGQFKTRLHYMSEIQERAKKELGASETSVRLLYLALTDIDKNHRLDFRKLAECSERDFRNDIIGMSDYATSDGVLHGWKPKCHKPVAP